jgi:hypothetical protein
MLNRVIENLPKDFIAEEVENVKYWRINWRVESAK